VQRLLGFILETLSGRTSGDEAIGIDDQGSQPGYLNLESGGKLGVPSLI
jgi:hypothetical protein